MSASFAPVTSPPTSPQKKLVRIRGSFSQSTTEATCSKITQVGSQQKKKRDILLVRGTDGNYYPYEISRVQTTTGNKVQVRFKSN